MCISDTGTVLLFTTQCRGMQSVHPAKEGRADFHRVPPGLEQQLSIVWVLPHLSLCNLLPSFVLVVVFWNSWKRNHNLGPEMPRRKLKAFSDRQLLQKLPEYCKALPWC